MSIQPQISYQASKTNNTVDTTTTYGEELVLDPTFSSRHPNIEGNIWGRLEVATIAASTLSPAPSIRPVVIFEDAKGLPGILTYLWNAIGGAGVQELFRDQWNTGLVYTFYFDDDINPAFSVDAFDMFTFGQAAPSFSLPRVGVSKLEGDNGGGAGGSGYDGFGAYRYMFAPYNHYCRVELSNSNSTSAGLWAQVSGHRLKSPYSGPKKSLVVTTSSSDALDEFSSLNMQYSPSGDETLRGQVEHAHVRAQTVSGDNAFQEGDVAFYDGWDTNYPVLRTTGMEDFANAAFGVARAQTSSSYFMESRTFNSPGTSHTHNFVNPIDGSTVVSGTGGANAHTHQITINGLVYQTSSANSGASGTTAHTHTVDQGIPAATPVMWPAGSHNMNGVLHYRWFQNDPIFYNDGFQFNWNAGQFGQPNTTPGSVIKAASAVTHHVDKFRSVNFVRLPSPDSAALRAERIWNADLTSVASIPSFFGSSWSTFGSPTISYGSSGASIVKSTTTSAGIGVQIPSTLQPSPALGNNIETACLFYTARGRVTAMQGGDSTLLQMGVNCAANVAPTDGTNGNGIDLNIPSDSNVADAYIEHRYRNSIVNAALVGRGLSMVADAYVTFGVKHDRYTNSAGRYTYYVSYDGEDTWWPIGYSTSSLSTSSRYWNIGIFNGEAVFTDISVYRLPRIQENV